MCTRVASARAVIPANIVTVSAPMMVSVAAAFRLLGARKFGTPLLTASTPVRAVLPEANDRSTIPITTSGPTEPIPGRPRLADSATGGLPVRNWYQPSPSIAKTLTMNA